MVALDAGPDARPAGTADYCRPFHAGGPLVELVRLQMRARAEGSAGDGRATISAAVA